MRETYHAGQQGRPLADGGTVMLVERPMEWWAKRAEGADDGCVTAGGRGKGATLWDRLHHGVSSLKASGLDPAKVEAMAPASVLGAMVHLVIDRRRELEDAELRRMLGCWVSEMEPWLARWYDMRIAGLTIRGASNPDGTTPLYVLSQYVDPADPWGAREAYGDALDAPLYMRPLETDDHIMLDLRP